MDNIVLAAVVFAAFLHAVWNALVKAGIDRFTMMLMIAVVQTAISIVMLPFVPLPAAAAWPWLLVTTIPHTTYKIFLALSYDSGELSRVYPIMRGLVLCLTTGASIALVGEALSASALAGVAVIGVGVVVLSIPKARTLLSANVLTLLLTMGAAASAAAYTVVDAIGVRVSGTVAGFVAWMFVLDGAGMFLYALAARGTGAFRAMHGHLRIGVLAGSLAFSCYWIALWAFANAPIATVAALRETSVLFAMLIARFRLQERFGAVRVAAALAIVAGIALVRIG